MHRHKRGVVIVAMTVVLLIIDLIIVGVVISGSRDHNLSIWRVESVQAFYASEAGLNMAIRELVVNEDQDIDCIVGCISNDEDPDSDPSTGAAQFMATATPSGSEWTLVSYGRAGDIRRQATAVIKIPTHEIVFDNVTDDWGTLATLNFNHTIGGGDNRLLVVNITIEATTGNEDVTAVTYNGVAMTKAVENTVGSSYRMNVEMWYLLEANLPAAGTYEVAITSVAAIEIEAAAVSVEGAAQEPPEATAVNDDGGVGNPSITTQITTLTSNAWVFECVGSGAAISGFTPDSGQVERWDVAAGGSRGAGSTLEISSAGTVNQGWSAQSSSNRMSHVLAAFKPH